MLKKKCRLAVQHTLLKKSKRVQRSRFFLVKIFPSTKTYPRISFVVGRKVAKKAVERNQIRRRLYRAVAPLLPTMAPADYVCLISRIGSEITEMSEDAIVSELKKVLYE